MQTEREWWESLSKAQKRQIETLQWELSEQGFGVDTDFKMKACWNEAVRRLRPTLKPAGD